MNAVHDRLDSGCPTATPSRRIRDGFAGGQHYPIAGMNLLAAIIIFWTNIKLGEVVANQKCDGKLLSSETLVHVSPLGWEHLNLTGEYRWPKP